MLVRPDSVLPASASAAGGVARDEAVRSALRARHAELSAEYADAVAEMTLSGAVDAGDDVADLGTKAFTREQEFALSVTLRERMDQVERALQRLDEGRYGVCEGCAQEIPVARLAAFPSATRCVTCKQAQERH